jgi:hypothetical protein
MAGKTCGPPKTQAVKGYTRGAPKRKRKQPTPTGPYWTCVNRTGRTCGVHHRKFTGALSHRKKLDKAARDYRARHGKRNRAGRWMTPVNDWHIEKRGT